MSYKLLFRCCIIIFLISCDRQIPFDSTKWKASGGESILTKIRLSMTTDLLDSGLLIGKTKNEIDDILGPSSLRHNGDKDKIYYMVQEVYSWDIDPDELIYLELTFSNIGGCLNAEIIKSR